MFSVKSSTPNPVIPDDNGKGPKNYQKKLLEAFNIFCPLGKEPMRYSDMLEKDARIIYRTSPHKKYFHRFDARLTISEEEFYSNPKKAFMTALSMEEKEVNSSNVVLKLLPPNWMLCPFEEEKASAAHTLYVRLAWMRRCLRLNQCDK
ncbi:hypothetical protein GCK32_009277 [Trichostrongylus colubriformis]|uniref:Uncharacterized protein n=1 Tax=Trichostrongylus colubriformis TaxID=6319 RepID=A0AAN8IBC1_TRICO